jgi:hypothetical protein
VFHTKLPVVKLLELSWICTVRGSLRWDARPGAKRLSSFVSPSFKLCRSLRKSEWCRRSLCVGMLIAHLTVKVLCRGL